MHNNKETPVNYHKNVIVNKSGLNFEHHHDTECKTSSNHPYTTNHVSVFTFYSPSIATLRNSVIKYVKTIFNEI